MNRMRLRIAERLKQSQNAAASLTTFNEIDMSALIEMRKKYKGPVLDEHGVKLGFMSFFARASALALSEALMLIEQIGDDPARADHLRRSLRDDWERVHIVPVDQRCLDRAAELGRTQPLRTVDALHLAAADRLPRPVRFVTFDPAQIPVALAMGFDVVSTEG